MRLLSRKLKRLIRPAAAACLAALLWLGLCQNLAAQNAASPEADKKRLNGDETAGGLLVGNVARQGRLTVYTATNHFDPMVLDYFARTTGYQVRLEYYRDTKELAATAAANGLAGYDLVVLPSAALGNLADMEALAPIPPAVLANKGHNHPKFSFAGYYHGQDYGVPLFWGVMGIIQSSASAAPSREPVNGWRDFLNPTAHRQGVVLPDTPRESLGIALQHLGYSLNSTNPAQVNEAAGQIRKLFRSPLFLGFTSKEQGAGMCEAGLVAMAVSSGPSASAGIRANSNIEFKLAAEGVPASSEVISVASRSRQKALAFKFVDYLQTPTAAARNANYTHIPTTNQDAMDMINAADRNDPALYPSLDDFARLEFYMNLGESGRIYDQAWMELTGGRDESLQ